MSIEKILNSIIRFLKSTKLAVVLILIITILAILSTLIPQGENGDYYIAHYPEFLSFLILITGFHHFPTSWVFIIPVTLFSINLITCTIKRLSREITKKIHYRFGPDIIHIGILVLILGGLITLAERVEEFTYLGEGDSVVILGNYELMVEKFEFIQYADGRPKDWISTVSIIKDEKKIRSSFPVEVNHPLKFKGIEILQSDYTSEPMLIMTDKNDREYRWIPGHIIKTDQSTILFHGINSNPQNKDDIVALFEENFSDSTMRLIYGKISDVIGDYTIKEMYLRDMTGLKFISDPGFLPVIAGLILIGIGLSLTFIQKIGDKKI